MTTTLTAMSSTIPKHVAHSIGPKPAQQANDIGAEHKVCSRGQSQVMQSARQPIRRRRWLNYSSALDRRRPRICPRFGTPWQWH